MATISNIGIEKKDGTIDFIYCHWDGYFNGVGSTLLKDYTTKEEVEKLILRGDCASLDEPYTDLGEDYEDLKPRTVRTKKEAFQQEYCYIFTLEEKWIASNYEHTWVNLEEVV